MLSSTFSGFSRTGIIGQLEYEGFSTADATWAADNVAADWNEERPRAPPAVCPSPPRKQGLIDQLLYEGFTADQAEHGVSQTYGD